MSLGLSEMERFGQAVGTSVAACKTLLRRLSSSHQTEAKKCWRQQLL